MAIDKSTVCTNRDDNINSTSTIHTTETITTNYAITAITTITDNGTTTTENSSTTPTTENSTTTITTTTISESKSLFSTTAPFYVVQDGDKYNHHLQSPNSTALSPHARDKETMGKSNWNKQEDRITAEDRREEEDRITAEDIREEEGRFEEDSRKEEDRQETKNNREDKGIFGEDKIEEEGELAMGRKEKHGSVTERGREEEDILVERWREQEDGQGVGERGDRLEQCVGEHERRLGMDEREQENAVDDKIEQGRLLGVGWKEHEANRGSGSREISECEERGSEGLNEIGRETGLGERKCRDVSVNYRSGIGIRLDTDDGHYSRSSRTSHGSSNSCCNSSTNVSITSGIVDSSGDGKFFDTSINKRRSSYCTISNDSNNNIDINSSGGSNVYESSSNKRSRRRRRRSKSINDNIDNNSAAVNFFNSNSSKSSSSIRYSKIRGICQGVRLTGNKNNTCAIKFNHHHQRSNHYYQNYHYHHHHRHHRYNWLVIVSIVIASITTAASGYPQDDDGVFISTDNSGAGDAGTSTGTRGANRIRESDGPIISAASRKNDDDSRISISGSTSISSSSRAINTSSSVSSSSSSRSSGTTSRSDKYGPVDINGIESVRANGDINDRKYNNEDGGSKQTLMPKTTANNKNYIADIKTNTNTNTNINSNSNINTNTYSSGVGNTDNSIHSSVADNNDNNNSFKKVDIGGDSNSATSNGAIITSSSSASTLHGYNNNNNIKPSAIDGSNLDNNNNNINNNNSSGGLRTEETIVVTDPGGDSIDSEVSNVVVNVNDTINIDNDGNDNAADEGLIFQTFYEQLFSSPEMRLRDHLVRYAYPNIILLGNITNLLVLLVFRRPKLKSTSVGLYLCAYAIANLCVLDLILGVTWVCIIFDKTYITSLADWTCRFWTFITSVMTYTGIWLVVCANVDRLVYSRLPNKAQNYCTVFSAKTIISFVVIGLIVVSIHAMWTYELQPQGCFVSYQQDLHTIIWPWWSATVYSYIPLILLLVLSVVQLVIICVRSVRPQVISANRANHVAGSGGDGGDDFVTTVLIVSISFVVLTVPTTAIDLLYIHLPSEWLQADVIARMELATNITEILSSLNNSILGLVLIMCSSDFRSELWALFRSPCCCFCCSCCCRRTHKGGGEAGGGKGGCMCGRICRRGNRRRGDGRRVGGSEELRDIRSNNSKSDNNSAHVQVEYELCNNNDECNVVTDV